MREWNNKKKNTEMPNEGYRAELEKRVIGMHDNRILRCFYIFVSEKLKRVM